MLAKERFMELLATTKVVMEESKDDEMSES